RRSDRTGPVLLRPSVPRHADRERYRPGHVPAARLAPPSPALPDRAFQARQTSLRPAGAALWQHLCHGWLPKRGRPARSLSDLAQATIGALEDVNQHGLFLWGDDPVEEGLRLVHDNRSHLGGESSTLGGDEQFLCPVVLGGNPPGNQAMRFETVKDSPHGGTVLPGQVGKHRRTDPRMAIDQEQRRDLALAARNLQVPEPAIKVARYGHIQHSDIEAERILQNVEIDVIWPAVRFTRSRH